jgi:ubiquinone/menaquinone biosynthesis C-methylase UbiE
MNAVENSDSETATDDLPDESGRTQVAAQVDKSGDRIQKMFGEISGRYDFLNHFLSGGVDYYWRWRTVRRIRPAGDLPILDVCTGTGDLAIAYWKKARGQAPVVGTDFTPEMLVIARQKSAKLGIAAQAGSSPTDAAETDDSASPGKATLTFIEADTMQLPPESNLFQIVSVAFGLRNVSDTVAGLKEMTRVCKPGGQVAVLEFSMPDRHHLDAADVRNCHAVRGSQASFGRMSVNAPTIDACRRYAEGVSPISQGSPRSGAPLVVFVNFAVP